MGGSKKLKSIRNSFRNYHFRKKTEVSVKNNLVNDHYRSLIKKLKEKKCKSWQLMLNWVLFLGDKRKLILKSFISSRPFLFTEIIWWESRKLNIFSAKTCQIWNHSVNCCIISFYQFCSELCKKATCVGLNDRLNSANELLCLMTTDQSLAIMLDLSTKSNIRGHLHNTLH